MAQLIQLRRGLKANLPASAALGEPLFATDTSELYVGTGSGVVLVTGTDENVKVGAAGAKDYLNENYFEQDGVNHIRIKQNTLLTGVDADKVDGKNVDDAQTSTDYLWTAGKIKDYVDGLINGLDWQESVLDRDLATPPVSPTTGDRYIVATSGTGDWLGHDGEVTEWDGTAWQFYAPNEGFSLRVEDEDSQLVYNGTAWVKFGSTTSHNETIGLQGGTTGEYYHLTNAQHGGLTGGTATTLHKHDVNTAELVDDSVTAAKINADVAGLGLVQNGGTGALDVNVDGSTLEISTDTVQVKDLGITTAKLADSAVTTVKIADTNVTTIKLADSAVTTIKIADSNVTTAKLADDSVTAAKINADVAGDGLVANGTTGALDVNPGNGIEIDTDTVTVKLDGASLAKSATGLKVSAVDADVVAVTNLEVDNLKAGVLDVDLSSVSAADDTLASAKAIKAYVDGEITTVSGLLSTHESTTSGIHGVTGDIVGTSDAQTLTNKTIDASLNTISNLDVADFAGSAIETAGEGLTATDSAIPTSSAVKNYVDAVAQGLAVHAPVRLATTAELTATYDNGTSGVGATLTNSGTQAALTLDGQTVSVADRILVKDQTTNPEYNGIYVVTTVGDGSTNWVLTRAEDYDNSPANEIHDGDFFFVTEGSTLSDNGFVQINTDPITVGTGAINFAQFSGAGQVIAGDALTKSGNTLNVNVDASTIEISADALRVKDLGITTAKLANDAVTTLKILDANVTTAKLADSAVTTIKIADANVTTAKILDANVTTVKLADSAVTTIKIADANVTTAKLADDSVTAAKINADVAGLGLIQNVGTGALDINVAQTMQISSDAIAVKYQSTNSIAISEDASGLKADLNTQASSSVTFSVDGSGLKADVNVDDSSIKIDGVNNYIYVDTIDGGSF